MRQSDSFRCSRSFGRNGLILPTIGQLLCLLWETIRREPADRDTGEKVLARLGGSSLALSDVRIERIELSSEEAATELPAARFDRADLSAVSFAAANLRGASFDEAILEGCSFASADLTAASCRSALLI